MKMNHFFLEQIDWLTDCWTLSVASLCECVCERFVHVRACREYVFTAHVSICVLAYACLTSSSPCSTERWTDGHSGGCGGQSLARRGETKGRRKDFPISSPSFHGNMRPQAVPQTCQTNRWYKGVFKGWQWRDAECNLGDKGDIVLEKWHRERH